MDKTLEQDAAIAAVDVAAATPSKTSAAADQPQASEQPAATEAAGADPAPASASDGKATSLDGTAPGGATPVDSSAPASVVDPPESAAGPMDEAQAQGVIAPMTSDPSGANLTTARAQWSGDPSVEDTRLVEPSPHPSQDGEMVGGDVTAPGGAIDDPSASTGMVSPPENASAPDGDAQGSVASGGAAQLTDDHHNWILQFCGVDLRNDQQAASRQAGQDAGSPPPSADEAGPDSGGGVWGSIKGAAASVEKSFEKAADAAGEVVAAVTHGDPSLGDLAWTAAGGITHLAAAAVPGGFVGAGAIDSLVASQGSQEQKFWYGVGTTAAGIADTAVGGAEIIGGGGLAPETGGLSLGVSAIGVNVSAAGAEALVAGAALMSGGPGTGSGSKPPAKPVDKAKPVDPVRRRHILDGDGTGGGHRAGTGAGKSEFPSSWTDDKVVQEIESVANNPNSSRIVQPNGRTRVEGTADGVKIRVVVDPDGTIRTAHPF